jgi:glycosyltransferase involved in cell wall biosynthesis
MNRLLFLSNLFPTAAEPYRGLDNATLLHALAAHFEIRAISPRPVLPWGRKSFPARSGDAPLDPRWVPSAYLPKIGSRVNHLLMAASLRHPFDQLMREYQPEVILSSWIYPDSLAALHVAHGRVPVVAIAQGTDVHQYLKIPARRKAILKYLPHAAAVITRSRELSRILENAGFPAATLHTVYNGVDLDTFQPRNQAAARREAGLPDAGRIILFVGNFYRIKNPLLLIRAFARLAAGDAVLVMAGGGMLEQACRDLAAELGVAPRVIFAGRKSPEEIARLMNAADLLALPSENEGVPNVLLEALASGLPVVASRTGGIPEVLDHESLGRMAPPGDLDAFAAALEAQLAAPRDIASIRLKGQCFSWDTATARYRDILAAALAAQE